MLKRLGLRKAQNRDFKTLVEISLPYIAKYGHEYFPCDENSLRQTFVYLLRSVDYFKVIEVEGTIMAWMAARETSPHPYSHARCLSQSFLHSCAEGALAVQIVKAFHSDLYETAQQRRFDVVCSSSFLPSKNSFYRILEKEGWQITPVGAIRKVDHG